ncbi:transcriptional regulator [Leptospira interrogans serovar Bataviae]|uniref:Transcriptional regulator n=1 Tax=Leptospira interrogans serovar Bataviae TaxID=312175 RepID=A0AAP9WN42_LEPIR|nr:transcriptional regulator [Leptospira interrogans serovar Bataviae]
MVNFYCKTLFQHKALKAILLFERIKLVTENEWVISERRRISKKIIFNLKSLVFCVRSQHFKF